jgi:hypothetical protein
VRLTAICLTSLVALAGSERAASADLLSGYAQIQGGGASGAGLFGDQMDAAFHKEAEGITYGAYVGVEIVFLDVWIEHNQFIANGGVEGTWTQFMTGIDVEFDLGPKEGGTRLENGQIKDGYSRWYGEFGLGAGFGVGTGQQVDPPLDNSQVTDKGFVFQASIGGGFRMSKYFSLGLSLPMQAGYMFKSGEGATANDLETNYGSMQAAALLSMRFKLQIK